MQKSPERAYLIAQGNALGVGGDGWVNGHIQKQLKHV